MNINHFIKMKIAGQEKFKTLTSSYYRGADGVIIVYSITDKQTFQNVSQWIKEITDYAPENVVKLLIGNKSDLEMERKVSTDEAQQFAQRLRVNFLEASAKTSSNVEEMFVKITKELITNNTAAQNQPNQQTADISSKQPKKEKKGFC